jgi:hypothetical protein
MQAVVDKASLFQKLRSHRIEIKSFGVKSIGVFGSFAKDAYISMESDVDLLVDFDPGKKTYDNFMELSFFLEDLLCRKVELITAQSLSKYIGPYILKEVEHVSL